MKTHAAEFDPSSIAREIQQQAPFSIVCTFHIVTIAIAARSKCIVEMRHVQILSCVSITGAVQSRTMK